MKKRIIKKISLLLVLIMMLPMCNSVFGTIEFKTPEYSEDYKKWLELPEEERTIISMPLNKYNIEQVSNNKEGNIFKTFLKLKASYTSKYDLREIIPENMKVKEQGDSGLCWAFAGLGVIESRLAMQDKLNGLTAKTYDFSELHLGYATARKAFLNDIINIKGYDRTANDGGSPYLVDSYLATGTGAVSEESMPYSDSNFPNIDINEINNKEVLTTLIDSEIWSDSYIDKSELTNKIKDFIMNNGAVSACISGDSMLREESDSYNNETGAIYTSDAVKNPIDHNVIIVGWDDNYSKTNFKEKNQPSDNGAWIIRNSWGDSIKTNLTELKVTYFDAYKNEFVSKGISSAEEIPDDFIISVYSERWGKSKVSIVEDELVIEIGDNGFMYVSYEDVNILSMVYAVKKIKNGLDYDNIYQYDYLEANGILSAPIGNGKYLIANVFDKQSDNEVITKIAITAANCSFENCKVYVNPNGSDKSYSSLQQVELLEGNTEKINIGYNTIEFANPIYITGDKFVVAIELNTNDKGNAYIPLLIKDEENGWKDVNPKSGISFCATLSEAETNEWTDLNEYGILPIKAFTNNINEEELILESIEISKEPNKLEYNIGDSFDKSGMQVIAKYTNGMNIEVTDYKILDGEELKENQKNITISYTKNGITKTTTQNITVKVNTIEEPKKITEPVLSDMNNINGSIEKAVLYLYTNEEGTGFKDDYNMMITVNISNIKLGDDISSRKFYYYLSSENGVNDESKFRWKEFTLNSNNTSATIIINTEELENIEKLDDNEKIYLYIKEVASLNDISLQQINTIELEAEDDANIEIYVNDELVIDFDNAISFVDNTDDTTIFPNRLPQTGITVAGMVITIIILSIAGLFYYKYKRIYK